jgi:hypothetical protein
MTDYEKRAFIAASGQVLTNILPENYGDENWLGDDGETIDEWVVQNAWEPFQHYSADQLWEQIDDVAWALTHFHLNEVKFKLSED